MVCTFFGHKDTPFEAEKKAEQIILYLIEIKGVNLFYVGNQGDFDFMVRRILKRLKESHNIDYFVILAYLPTEKEFNEDYSDTIYPEIFENVPHKYRINKRNQWMVENSDFVITYVTQKFGGAAKYKEYAERKNKTVYNIADF